MEMPLKFIFIAGMSISLLGCASAKLPLCSKIADYSYINPNSLPGKERYLNFHLMERLKSSRIKINITSPFSAEFSGSVSSIRDLESDYAELICAFDPANVPNDASLFSSCMNHADEWIELVQAGKIEDLFLDQYRYKPNCVE